jgi:hypothetical protein
MIVEEAYTLSRMEEVQLPLDVIEKQRDQVRMDAIAIGSRLYCEKPRRFVNRLQNYWEAWRPQTVASPADVPAEIKSANISSQLTENLAGHPSEKPASIAFKVSV